MEKNISYEEWIKCHKEDLAWVVEMAQNGINSTEGAGDHPANVFLYGLKCDIESI